VIRTGAAGAARELGAQIASNGYVLVPGLLTDAELRQIRDQLAAPCGGRAGTRGMLGHHWCAALGARIRTDPRLRPFLPREARVIQCTLFEKSLARNWLVALHQDLAIPVAERVASPQCQVWSCKEGTLHVQPPTSLLEELLAVRVHLSDCDESNGALCVVPGSHRFGRLDLAMARRLRDAHGERPVPCLAKDVLLMRPLLLHSSSKAVSNLPRPVLHFLLGPALLPEGLQWPEAGEARGPGQG
jgi:hypothetical protein